MHSLSSTTTWNAQQASFLTDCLSCVHLEAISLTSQLTPVVSTLRHTARQQRRTASSLSSSSISEKDASSNIKAGMMLLKCMCIVPPVAREMLPNASTWLIVNGVFSNRGMMYGSNSLLRTPRIPVMPFRARVLVTSSTLSIDRSSEGTISSNVRFPTALYRF